MFLVVVDCVFRLPRPARREMKKNWPAQLSMRTNLRLKQSTLISLVDVPCSLDQYHPGNNDKYGHGAGDQGVGERLCGESVILIKDGRIGRTECLTCGLTVCVCNHDENSASQVLPPEDGTPGSFVDMSL